MSVNILPYSVQLYRARTMRVQRGNAVHRNCAVHHQESGGALLVGADASQAKILHSVPETT